MDTTDEMVAFYKARLDEDEAQARSAILDGDGTWTQGNSEFDPTVIREGDASVSGDDIYFDKYGQVLAQAIHIARYDPARVLREVEVKRQLLAGYEDESGHSPDYYDGYWAAIWHGVDVWRDHPCYRPEWKP